MYKFKVVTTCEVTERVGASGMYQIEQLTLNGEDVTELIDQGMMFHEDYNLKDLTKYLAHIFKIKENEIMYENYNPEMDPDWPFK